MTTFFIPGHPRPQGSKRHVGNGRMIESSKHLKPWRDKCIQVMRLQNKRAPIDAPVKVVAEFVMPRPKRIVNPYPYQGDLDKLQRCMGDAMEQSGVLTNDSRIIHWIATKRYAKPDEQPGAHIHITQIIN